MIHQKPTIITKALAFLCGWFFCSFLAFSAETTLEIEQTTPNRQKAVQTAIQQLSQDLMERFIEPSKLKAQKKRIQKIISTYSNRYILYTKTETPVAKGPKSFVLLVRIGFSEDNLKKILLKEDLFYSGSSHLRILPLILLENKITKEVYGWWRKKNKPPVANLSMSAFYSHIQQALLPYHFFVVHAEQAGSRYFVPPSLLANKLSEKEKFKLSRFFKSHLVLIGGVTIRESDVNSFVNVKVQLSVYNTNSGRLLAEVERFEKVPLPEPSPQSSKNPLKNQKAKKALDYIALFLKKDTGFAKSLGSQLQLIYEEGQISSHVVKIQVQNTLSHLNLERFKKELISKTPALTGLKEHIMSQKSISYIANTSEGIEALSHQIKSQVFNGFEVRVDRVKKNNIYIEVTLKK